MSGKQYRLCADFGRKWLYGTQLVPAEGVRVKLGLVGEGDEIEDHVLLPVTLVAYVHVLILILLDQKVLVLGGEDDIVTHIFSETSGGVRRPFYGKDWSSDCM